MLLEEKKVSISQNWINLSDGSCYLGQYDSELMVKQGFGNALDIYGNVLLGYWMDDELVSTLVCTKKGFYLVSESELKNNKIRLGSDADEEEAYLDLDVKNYLILDEENTHIMGVYDGRVENGLPSGFGILNSEKGLDFFSTFKCFRYQGNFENGLAHGVIKCIVNIRSEPSEEDEIKSYRIKKLDLQVFLRMQKGKYTELLETRSQRKIFYHYCKFKDIGFHRCLIIDTIIRRPIYHGYTRYIKNESLGRGKNKYYEYLEKRVSDKVNMCDGVSFYFYPYDRIYSEVEWEDHNQLRNGDN